MSNPIDTGALLRDALAKLKEMRTRVETLERGRSEPIAIVGIG